VGFLAERGFGRSIPGVVALMALGHAIIFAFGLSWLATLVGPVKAWELGAAPFALATLVKTGLAAALLQAAWTAVPARPR
jgi:biotin transport system substrate-specific component